MKNTQMEMGIVLSSAEQAILDAMMEKKEASAEHSNPPTTNQVSTVHKLVEQKGVKLDETKLVSFDSTSKYIQELLEMKTFRPASEKQVTKIKEYCDLLGRSYPNFAKLEGGMDGSASKLIQKLQEQVKNIPVPASEKQVSFIEQMQLCPDCEVVEDVSAMLKADATDYINKYKDKFYTWQRERLTPDQVTRIKQLCEMMETPFVFSSIIQLTPDTASSYIEQLEREYNKKIWQQTTLEPESDRDVTEDYDAIRTELETFCHQLYGLMGQELEDEWFENFIGTTPILFSALKELVDEAKIWEAEGESRIKGFINNLKFFSDEQKALLVA